jgi:hypothetical protein
MEMNEISISSRIYSFFEENIYLEQNYQNANEKIYSVCGIKDFFPSDEDFLKVRNKLKSNQNLVKDDSRIGYGDFQTSETLADLVISRILENKLTPTVVLEPTCGRGNFILSVLKQTTTYMKFYCIEIYKPYIWMSKFNILDYFLSSTNRTVPHIEYLCKNIFDLQLNEVVKLDSEDFLLIVGNPPWVTNAQLGILNSDNLPKKSNFKGHNGFDAITGKGNFDIAEYISLMLLKAFSNINGEFAFLLKNIVIKNIINDQNYNRFRIGNIAQLGMDARKEFNVSADASLFYCKLNSEPEYKCLRSSIYEPNGKSKDYFGYVDGKFVSSIKTYRGHKKYDGKSTLVWRQGVKHDCSKIMELEKINSHFLNQNNEEVFIEEDLVYGLLKSSDLNKDVIETTRKCTIITQKKIGEDTSYIADKYPQTFAYLESNKAYFDARKSKIYKDKAPFSIFGIGDYSFYKYKVAISGLYKQTKFSLILPLNDKPIMLDDTCYFIGFNNIIDAIIILIALNHETTQEFFNSLIFFDSKRVITKDILMRIDLASVLNNIPFAYFKKLTKTSYSNLCERITIQMFENIIEKISNKNLVPIQAELF